MPITGVVNPPMKLITSARKNSKYITSSGIPDDNVASLFDATSNMLLYVANMLAQIMPMFGNAEILAVFDHTLLPNF